MLESKLNHEAIEAFAAFFSKKACDSFFEDKDTISGKEIVELTPVKQVNYFVLKILFRKWQKESLRLQSPYFNYRNEEVRKALISFMNVLSQQIKVNRDHLEPLLFQATREAVLLIVSPHDFFREELTGHESGKLNEKYIKNSAKYIKINQQIFMAFGERFDEQSVTEVSHEDALLLLDDVFRRDDLELEEIELYGSQFSELVEVDLASFLTNGPPTKPLTEEGEEDDDDAQEPDEEENEPEENEDDDDALTVEDTAEPESIAEDTEENDELVKFADDEEDEKPVFDTLEELDEKEEAAPEASHKNPLEFLSKDEDDDENDLAPGAFNQRFSSDKVPLHEQLKSEQRPSLAEVHQTQKIDNIATSITVNQRYMFINELFKGESELFVEAMSKVEGSDSFDEAVELLIQSYSKKLEWDMNAPEVKELLKIVFKKFR